MKLLLLIHMVAFTKANPSPEQCNTFKALVDQYVSEQKDTAPENNKIERNKKLLSDIKSLQLHERMDWAQSEYTDCVPSVNFVSLEGLPEKSWKQVYVSLQTASKSETSPPTDTQTKSIIQTNTRTAQNPIEPLVPATKIRTKQNPPIATIPPKVKKEDSSDLNWIMPILSLLALGLSVFALIRTKSQKDHNVPVEKDTRMTEKHKKLTEDINNMRSRLGTQIKELESVVHTLNDTVQHQEERIKHLLSTIQELETKLHSQPPKSEPSKDEPSAKKTRVKFGSKTPSKPTASTPTFPLVNLYNTFLSIWNTHQKTLKNLSSYQYFQGNLITNKDALIKQFSVNTLKEEEAKQFLLPVVDQIANLQSQLVLLNIETSINTTVLSTQLFELIYKGYNQWFQEHAIGKFIVTKPLQSDFQELYHQISESKSVSPQYKNKIIEVWGLGLMSMNGSSLLRRAKIVVGV